jgi:hypothetical protein
MLRQGQLPAIGPAQRHIATPANILPLKVGIIGQQFFYTYPRANLPDNHAHCYPHTPDTGLAAHHGGVLGYPVKVFIVHKETIP